MALQGKHCCIVCVSVSRSRSFQTGLSVVSWSWRLDLVSVQPVRHWENWVFFIQTSRDSANTNGAGLQKGVQLLLDLLC